MKTPRRSLLASLLLLLAGSAASAADAPPPPIGPAPDFPATDATVSLLEPAGGQCEWAKLDPLLQARRAIARIAVDCQGAATAFSRDGKRGAARFWRGSVSMPVVGKPTFPEHFPSAEFRDRLFTVDLVTGAVEEIALPPLGEMAEFGFDAKGRLLGLTLQGVSQAEARARAVVVAGSEVALDAEGDGRPLVAHAFVYEGGKWNRMESKGSTEVISTRVLDRRKDLGQRSSIALDPRFEPTEIENDEVLDQLYALTPEKPDGEWVAWKAGDYTLALWSTPYGEESLATGLLRKIENGKVIALPKYPYRPNDLVSPRVRGPYLLVSLADSGAHPRMYRGKKLVWSSETARAVMFWPR